jgi:hypothetical protein
MNREQGGRVFVFAQTLFEDKDFGVPKISHAYQKFSRPDQVVLNLHADHNDDSRIIHNERAPAEAEAR